jgi:MerR family copper efflux transcriptional regulator
MKIGELAKSAGVGIDTLRYYEREGLLPAPRRLASGYRDYGAHVLQRLRFVRRAKALGFTLPEIRDLLEISDHAGEDMAALKVSAREKLALIDERLAELTRMREGLATLIDACPGHGAMHSCPILGALAGVST